PGRGAAKRAHRNKRRKLSTMLPVYSVSHVSGRADERGEHTLAISLLVAAVITCASTTSVFAQPPTDSILTYTGPDRAERLVAGAKREGQVTYYSAMIVNQALRPLTAAFQKKYPFIKMAYWRGDSEDIEKKLSAEMRGNNPVGDVVEGTGIGELAVRA